MLAKNPIDEVPFIPYEISKFLRCDPHTQWPIALQKLSLATSPFPEQLSNVKVITYYMVTFLLLFWISSSKIT